MADQGQAQGQGQKIKEKIKHLFHHDKKGATTPDGSPGDVDVGTRQTNTTNNVPEAFYPGAAPVVPGETHSTHPYSSALGNQKITQGDLPTSAPVPQRNLPTSVPADSAAMLGAPPSSTKSNDAAVSENREVNPSSETPGTEAHGTADINPSEETPGAENDGTAGINPSDETPGTEAHGTADTNPSDETPGAENDGTAGINPSGETPGAKNDATADINPSFETLGAESDGTADINPSGESSGTESDEQTRDAKSGVKIEDLTNEESSAQTEDYPLTDSVLESKNPETDPEVRNAGVI